MKREIKPQSFTSEAVRSRSRRLRAKGRKLILKGDLFGAWWAFGCADYNETFARIREEWLTKSSERNHDS